MRTPPHPVFLDPFESVWRLTSHPVRGDTSTLGSNPPMSGENVKWCPPTPSWIRDRVHENVLFLGNVGSAMRVSWVNKTTCLLPFEIFGFATPRMTGTRYGGPVIRASSTCAATISPFALSASVFKACSSLRSCAVSLRAFAASSIAVPASFSALPKRAESCSRMEVSALEVRDSKIVSAPTPRITSINPKAATGILQFLGFSSMISPLNRADFHRLKTAIVSGSSITQPIATTNPEISTPLNQNALDATSANRSVSIGTGDPFGEIAHRRERDMRWFLISMEVIGVLIGLRFAR